MFRSYKVFPQGYQKFFLILLSNDNLPNLYRTNFLLHYHHNYSFRELEDMIPWEREIYVSMLLAQLKKEDEHREQQKRKQGFR